MPGEEKRLVVRLAVRLVVRLLVRIAVRLVKDDRAEAAAEEGRMIREPIMDS